MPFNLPRIGAIYWGLAADRPANPVSRFDAFFAFDTGALYGANDALEWQVVAASSGAGQVSNLTVVIDGGGEVITTGVKLDLEIPFACTITGVTLLADQTGSIVIDLWSDAYGNYPPTDADSITASAPPTLSAAAKSQDTTLTGWTTSLSAGTILRVNVDSATTLTRVTLSLTLEKV
jgi:hypothetical protein